MTASVTLMQIPEASRLLEVDLGDRSLALFVHALQMTAYAQEAELLQASDFPPLRRSVEDLQAGGGRCLAAFVGNVMVGAVCVEVTDGGRRACIVSLVVAPQCQRRGIARQMLSAVLREHGEAVVTVSTGAKNVPAINLYRQVGFEELARRWVGADSLEIVELCRRPPVEGSSAQTTSGR